MILAVNRTVINQDGFDSMNKETDQKLTSSEYGDQGNKLLLFLNYISIS